MTKYALCVGINAYPGSNALNGCVNDALDWQHALLDRGYQVSTMIDQQATMKNIKDALWKLVDLARYGDRAVFTYSGHGTYRADTSGDEPDKQDEAICPVDCFDIGMLYDDEIGNILKQRKFGVRLLQVSDSCFSGSVSRFVDLAVRKRVKFIAPHLLPERKNPVKPRLIDYGHNLLMSGCTDEEFSYDAWYGDRPNGAFTRAALDCLAHSPKTYADWNNMIRTQLPSGDYPQTPLLEGSWYRRHWATLA